MSGYEAVIGSLHEAAEAAHSAADQLAKVDPGGNLGSAVGKALPGASASIDAARSVVDAWKGRGQELATGMREFGDDLHLAGNKYAVSDTAARDNLDLSIDDPPSGGPKAV
ncbi:hypothetical protein [Prauserella flavalba]|uniref:Excreted virulence factor EspC, type VII ESX diderm n=1 Tax=Prauserella flavalba TaxID=1477506 RepID=A0A318LXT2_9PSEU|nr:hypothetical protein [Prauserella flavalba]PXY38551.1 hypothetical protein BA062_02080 [Prauserella flavalba]